MECPLCGHQKTHKQVKTSIGHQRYYCRVCRETFTCTVGLLTFDTLYYRATDSSGKNLHGSKSSRSKVVV